ncbi:MAG: hypothetical protein ACFFE8_02560 [Candidatus Heimdallarchaeota archaeon]
MNDRLKQVVKTKEEIQAGQMAQLADRVLILLSFKDAPIQNLSFILKALGIQTIEEKSKILDEIFRLIREGIVYIPDMGLPNLIRNRLSNAQEFDNIDIRLLQPYDKIIGEIQRQVSEVREELEKKNYEETPHAL